MKLLFDENISYRIIQLLLRYFPDSIHVSNLKNARLTDLEIWQYARDQQYCIVTYDEDFYEWQNLKGMPPKIIWLRFGNAKTKIIAEKLIKNVEQIQDFLSDENLGLIEIH